MRVTRVSVGGAVGLRLVLVGLAGLVGGAVGLRLGQDCRVARPGQLDCGCGSIGGHQ